MTPFIEGDVPVLWTKRGIRTRGGTLAMHEKEVFAHQETELQKQQLENKILDLQNQLVESQQALTVLKTQLGEMNDNYNQQIHTNQLLHNQVQQLQLDTAMVTIWTNKYYLYSFKLSYKSCMTNYGLLSYEQMNQQKISEYENNINTTKALL